MKKQEYEIITFVKKIARDKKLGRKRRWEAIDVLMNIGINWKEDLPSTNNKQK